MNRLFLVAVCLFQLIPLGFGSDSDNESICYGTTSDGRLENGVTLPKEGKNFEPYSSLARILGRTYVHSKVRGVVVDAYNKLEKEQPDKVYKYAETGSEEGGRFKPHKTHQNGLSVDFTVPVINEKGKSVYLPTHMFNKYGYDIEFDKSGKYEEYTIDFEALGAHIVALHKTAQHHGIGLWRILLAPDLQPYLYATRYGGYIREHIQIPEKQSWVRHDDHYHVDFDVPCERM